MTGRSRPFILALLFTVACSHPMMKDDEEPVTLQPSPAAAVSAGGSPAAAGAGSVAPGAPPVAVSPAPGAPSTGAPFDSDNIRFDLDESVWRKISDSDGIQAYERRPGKNPYGDVVAFRGETVMPVRLVKIATVLNAPELQKEWVDSLDEARVIEKISNFESIGYNKTNVPWPFHDRDFVYKIDVKVQIDPPVMLIRMKSIEDPRMPPVEGTVRGEMLISYFYMKELPGERTKMVIEMAVDPKGAIPLWLVNAAQKKWPSNTLKKLTELAMRPSIPVSREIEDYFHKPKPQTQTKRGKKK